MAANEQRVCKHLEALAQFTATPGEGITRLSYSSEDVQARTYLKSQMNELGLTVYEDAVGNIYGRLDGSDPTLPPVMIGSHFDTVPHGGAFDGQAGVIAGLEVLALFKEQQLKPLHSIEVLAMIEEEGASFGSSLFGSRAIAGLVSSEDIHHMFDVNGISAAEKMANIGFDANKVHGYVRGQGDIRAFIELHIEQGPVLELAGIEIGIVDTIVGLTQMSVTITGKASHAGSTPMDMRADALLAASRIIQDINHFAIEATESVATVGKLAVYPNGANVIPSKVVFSIDVRSKYKDRQEQLLERIKARIEAENRSGISTQYEQFLSVEPVHMNNNISALLQQNSHKLGFSNQTMVSGAGHDAMVFAGITEVGMVFVPSRDGLSHHPDEWTDYAQICKGIDVVFETVKEIAKVAK